MPSESLHSEAAARNAALTRLREEHRAVARLLEALETVTAELLETQAEPDFGLLAGMLYYLDAVPERFHHPKEDRYLFAVLKARDPQAAALVERLQREHQRSPHLVAELERTLVHWQGGASDGRDAFALAVSRFAEFTWSHMCTEEAELLPAAERSLCDADWMEMAEAFGANPSPMLDPGRRGELERLYHRIGSAAPRRLKWSFLRSTWEPHEL